MTELFEHSTINGMTLANRFVRSATWEGMAADDGACTPKLIDLMVELAKGGIGLIISSHAYVSPAGQAGPWQLGVYSDALVPGLAAMAKAVHDNGGKIVLQLAHAGFFANAKLTGQTPMAPSYVEGFAKGRGSVKVDGQESKAVVEPRLGSGEIALDHLELGPFLVGHLNLLEVVGDALELDLDRPLHEQLISYLAGAATGDFGVSFRNGESVFDLVAPGGAIVCDDIQKARIWRAAR